MQELDKNTFINNLNNLYNMNKKGVLNILHNKMTIPILRWRYFKLTDLTIFLVVVIFSPIIVHKASNVLSDLHAFVLQFGVYIKKYRYYCHIKI